MIHKSKAQNFKSIFFEILFFIKIDNVKSRVLQTKDRKLYFNWGIIWETLSPLLIVIGLSILVTLGIRGSRMVLEFVIFLFLFWFAFTSIITSIIQTSVSKFIFAKSYINPWIIFIGIFANEKCALFLRFIIVYTAMDFLGYILQPYHLATAMVLLTTLGFFYGIAVSYFFHDNAFFKDLHNFFLTGLFFTSSIIIPVTSMPENIREILLYNPLVHLMEWVKVPTTGVQYSYIDINYFLNFWMILAILSPIFLYLKNNRYNQSIFNDL